MKCKRHFGPWALLAFFTVFFLARGTFGYQVMPGGPQITDMTDTHGYPSAVVEWNNLSPGSEDRALTVSLVSPVAFTGLSVGWDVAFGEFDEEDFEIHIRTRALSEDYGEWYILAGEYGPGANPTGLYWSDLFLTPDERVHHEFEIKVVPPGDAAVSLLKVSLADLTSAGDPTPLQAAEVAAFQASTSLTPNIVTRCAWWGSLPPEHLDAPEWLPQAIDPSHTIVHHTVTHNNPSNPAQAVRNIWHYHAVTLGWGDIGYNFLIDQHGNIYQGRYNPWLYVTDTRAGHAGMANTKSFGVSLLGQFHPTASPTPGEPTTAALASLENIIAWRFFQYGLNPLESDIIETKRYGFINVPRISGHRNVGATACPGDNLYVHLPAVRTNVNSKITAYVSSLNQNIFRIAGDNRYATAVEISQAGWPAGSETVLLARGDDFADALAAVPLAYFLDAPLLLTACHQLTEATKAEISRLKAGHIIILGNTRAVSAEVEADLQDMGLGVERLAGRDRYATAARIAAELTLKGAGSDTAFITAGTDYPDTLSASAYAALQGYPILMTSTDRLPVATAQALDDLGIKNTIVIGGTSAVSSQVFNALPNPERIAGDNRYATSVALAAMFLPEGQKNLYMATGLDFPDAIAGAVLAAKNASGILLVQGTQTEPNQVVRDFLLQSKIDGVTLFGGGGVILRSLELWLKENL